MCFGRTLNVQLLTLYVCFRAIATSLCIKNNKKHKQNKNQQTKTNKQQTNKKTRHYLCRIVKGDSSIISLFHFHFREVQDFFFHPPPLPHPPPPPRTPAHSKPRRENEFILIVVVVCSFVVIDLVIKKNSLIFCPSLLR